MLSLYKLCYRTSTLLFTKDDFENLIMATQKSACHVDR